MKQTYDENNPPDGYEYAFIISSYKGTFYNGVGEVVDVTQGIKIRREQAPDESYLFFRKLP